MSTAISASTARRNVLVLALAQALFIIGTSTMLAEAAIVGYQLADDKSFATMPVALQQLGMLLTAFPASILMRHIGRRAGFSVGALFGIVGMTVATVGVLNGSFAIFCVGAALNGIYNGFGQYYRFAAVDGSDASWKSKAISYTLTGGVLAALIGPELAKLTKDMAAVPFAGSFMALTAVAMLALLILQLIEIPKPSADERAGPSRPLPEIMRQPTFIVAVTSGMVGYGGMAFLMTVTPLAVVACGYPFESAAFVIQWHVLAMFAPSFVTGTLIQRYGVLNMMLCGAALFVASVLVGISGTAVWQFWLGLVLVGLAWNLLYVGATTLVTETYRPAEKAKVQAANDFLLFLSVVIGAMSSGAVHNWVGWAPLNLMTVPFLVCAIGGLIWLRGRRRLVPA